MRQDWTAERRTWTENCGCQRLYAWSPVEHWHEVDLYPCSAHAPTIPMENAA
jgi:hypothetical protein